MAKCCIRIFTNTDAECKNIVLLINKVTLYLKKQCKIIKPMTILQI